MKTLKRVGGLLLAGLLLLCLAAGAFVVSRLYLFDSVDPQTQAQYDARLETLKKENAAAPMELDPYGGWVNAPESLGQSEPGDYFRVEKRGGAWWFITPDGHPFVSKGATDVQWLGATYAEGPYHDVLVQKYGAEDGWARAQQARLLDWGYNSVGPWSSHSMTPLMPHSIIILDSAGLAPRHPNLRLADYWSQEFSDNAATVAKQRATPYVEDKNLLGYFLDNELIWGADHFLTNKSLLELYMEFPADAPGRAEALRFVREAAGTVERFNADWGTKLSEWRELDTLSSGNFRPKTKAANEVAGAFAVAAFHQYAAVAIAGLRAVDPNHLILGCRFHAYPGDAMVRAAAEHFDVISMAAYAETPPVKEIDAIFGEVDKPFFIEEWSFKSRGTGLLNIQMYAPVVPNLQARALAYVAYVESFMRRPYAVGYHWYKWMDNPWEGVKDIIRGDNFGLMTWRDEPYTPFVDFVGEVNRRVEAWHAQGGR